MRDRAEALSGAAVRALRTAFPVIATITIFYAVLLGLLNLMQAIGHRVGMFAEGVGQATHVAMWEGPAIIPALLGVFMIVLAYELWLRKRAALVVLCSFVVVQAVVDSARGMSRPALAATVLVAAILMSAAKEFPGKVNDSSLKSLKVALPVAATCFFAFGISGLYLMRTGLGVKELNVYALAYRSIAVAVGESGLHFHGATMIFKGSLTFMAIAAIVAFLVLLFRPYKENGGRAPEDHKLAQSIVKSYGSDSLAYFNLRSDKQVFFHGEDSFLAYKVVGDVAVISGDPVGPPENIPAIMASFKEYCLDRGWRLVVLGASGTMMPYYEEAEMRSWSLGEETMIDLGDFTLEGRQVRKLRQAVNKVEKAGYRMEFLYTAGIPTHMKHELMRISRDWRGGKEETGFSMGLGRLFSPEDPDCLLCLAYDADHQPVGFLHFVPMYPHIGYSLDVHRSKIGAPGPLSEFMIAKTALFLKSEGYRTMSLHFLALSENYREDRETEGSKFYRGVAIVLNKILPIVSSYNFDKKFMPTWKKRYLVHFGFVDLLLVGLAAVKAESALGVTRPSDHRKAAE